MTTRRIFRQSPVVWTYLDECTFVQKATILIVEHYPKINTKKTFLQKSKVTRLEARASSDKKAVLVYTCSGGNPACIHKNTHQTCLTTIRTEKGDVLCLQSLKDDAAADSNLSYFKALPQLMKNKVLAFNFVFLKNTFLPLVCCIMAKTSGVRSVWAQKSLITMSLKKWPKPLNAFCMPSSLKRTHRLLFDTNRNKGKPGAPEPAVLGSAGEQQAPQQQQQQQQQQGKKPSFITSDN